MDKNSEGERWFHALCLARLISPPVAIFDFVSVDDVPPTHWFQRAIVVPRGSFFFLFAIYPTIAFIRGPLRRWRRRRRGLCLKCGYNLEGNVSGVCPECGVAR